MDDAEIRSLVARLARAHPSGGTVIERAAIFAEGADSAAVMAWIERHNGEPEMPAAKAPSRGLHGSRLHDSGASQPRTPSRFILPAGALD